MQSLRYAIRRLIDNWKRKEPLFGWPNWIVGLVTLNGRRFRQPDFVVKRADSDYLRRWWVLPRNPFFNVYLHQFVADDDDRALHDHPWLNCSILLRGSYLEHLPPTAAMGSEFDAYAFYLGDDPGLCLAVWRDAITVTRCRYRSAPAIVCRRPTARHRIELINGAPVWTLFLTGPVVRAWGFHCRSGWKHWRAFTTPGSKGETGAGCAE